MARRTVDVNPVDHEDLRDVTSLWLAARVDSRVEQGGRGAASRTAGRARRAPSTGVQAFVARLDGEAVGYAIATENLFGLSPTAEPRHRGLWVGPDARRHGVAKALIAAVLSCAERAGCEVVVSNVPTRSRDANRFFARLGFSSVIVRRVVSTSRCAASSRRRASRRGTSLLRRRRSLRSRAFAAPSRPDLRAVRPLRRRARRPG